MSSDEPTGTGRVACGDKEMSTLMTMLFAIESIEKSKDKASSSQGTDPAADIRKLCSTLDDMLGGGGREAKAVGLGSDCDKGRSGSDLVSRLAGKLL